MSIQKVSASDNIFHKTLLRDNLKAIFGDFDETILHSVEDKLEWLELEGGDVLIKEGDIGDSLYFVLSGRLEATVLLENGTSNKIGEIVRGETVGEMSIYTGEPRFATVTALRNCVLVKLSKTLFEEILESYPQVSLNVTKLVIERFKKNQNKLITNHLINICIISIHDSIDLSTISTYIFNKLKLQNEVLLLDKGFIEESFGPLPEHNDDSGDYSKKLTNWLNNQEANHDTMLYVCNEKDDYWYTKSIRQADHIVILADSTAKPKVTSIEISKLAKVNAIKTFILVHPQDTFTPSNTRSWLALRPWIDNVLHIKKENLKDLNRLARVVSGNAIGIVFAGGGAKGFAHLGIIKALQEYGIVYDYLGGTSVGAIMASANAFDRPIDEVINIGRKAAFYNPSKDINFLPLLSIIKGKRLKMMIGNAIKALSGTNKLDIADTWKPLFIIATNFTKAEEQVLMRGDLVTSVVASSSLPGIYPPVIIDGNLFVDGGTFNNFPVDVMRKIGIQKIIGIDFMIDKNRSLDIEKMPSNFELLRDKLFFWRKTKYKLPSLTSTIVNSTILYSTSRRNISKNMLDLHFNPNVNKFGITSWAKFDDIVSIGYNYALEILQNMTEEELDKFRDFKE